ncbi:DUF4998 domain-containing protein [Compostibacter hankyongensis]|uniref:F5/8 type C domain-containing protein n=1 Tax=Compostibacter hankyongensis TaxID=1007089 RepID=A0ABP8FJA4_9BACT
MKIRLLDRPILRAACLLIAVCGIHACSKMDATYRDLLSKGPRVYVGKADSLKAYPGHNRIKLSWLAISDPAIKRAVVYWNNRSDSSAVTIQKTSGVDTINVILPDMPEGTYSFEVITYDDEGHSSVPAYAIGEVFGDNYIRSLHNRIIEKALFNNDSLQIVWGRPEAKMAGIELRYADTTGAGRLAVVPADADTSFIEDYDFSTADNFRYRTMYLPDSLSIDTFYTPYDTIRVIGAPVEYPKTGWTATASDYRQGNGPGSIIDNDPGTIWVNEANTDFPHVLMVDMGKTIAPVDGFSFQQRTPTADPRVQAFELLVSDDGTQWRSLGTYELADEGDLQHIDLTTRESFRYFRVVCNTVYRNKPNVSLAEVGVYRR